jgi:precorrin-6B methylase 1
VSIYDSTVRGVGSDIRAGLTQLGSSIVKAAQIIAEGQKEAARIQKGISG